MAGVLVVWCAEPCSDGKSGSRCSDCGLRVGWGPDVTNPSARFTALLSPPTTDATSSKLKHKRVMDAAADAELTADAGVIGKHSRTSYAGMACVRGV